MRNHQYVLGRRKKITCGGAATESSKCPDVSPFREGVRNNPDISG
jgi:hypothetical protein